MSDLCDYLAAESAKLKETSNQLGTKNEGIRTDFSIRSQLAFGIANPKTIDDRFRQIIINALTSQGFRVESDPNSSAVTVFSDLTPAQYDTLDEMLLKMAHNNYEPDLSEPLNVSDMGTLSREEIERYAKAYPILSNLTTDQIINGLVLEPLDDGSYEIMFDELDRLGFWDPPLHGPLPYPGYD